MKSQMIEALELCQKALSMMITPAQIDQTSTLQAFAIATEAEAKARAALSVPAAAVVGEPIGYVHDIDGPLPVFSKEAPTDRTWLTIGADATPVYAAPSAPDGWQLVPVTPTPEMVTDGRITGSAVDACKYIKDYGDLFRSQWERALRAAPTPPQPIGAQDWRRNCQYLLDVLDGQGFASSDLSEEDDDAISFIRASLGEATKEV